MATSEDPRNKLQIALSRKSALWNERNSWLPQWKDISKFVEPSAGRFQTTDTNRGDAQTYNSIIDNTATKDSIVLASGLMSGITSPARPWFRLVLGDKDLMESAAVKMWLFDVASLMRSVFNQSNTYRTLSTMYQEIGNFGTTATVVLSNFDNVIHHYPCTVGEFALGTDDLGKVDTFVRELRMTVIQLVKMFGLDNCSDSVRNMFKTNRFDQWVDIIHIIQPRSGRNPSKRDSKNMPYESIYFEPGRAGEDKTLRISGFKRFPVLAPRWHVTGNDVYGKMAPGMVALGDVKQLQHQQLRKGQAIDYQVNPPLQVPTKYKDAQRNRLPGGVMFVDQAGAADQIRAAYQPNMNLRDLTMDIQDVRERIHSAYFADLFLMLANDQRSGITATEVAERHEEKLLMLGPVLERLHQELLQPLVDITFDMLADAGALPPPPPELQDGTNIDIEFISVLAQAQRAIGAQGTDRLLATVAQIAPMYPGALDKINFDQAIDDYADQYGVNPALIVPDDVVAQKREAAAAQQAKMQAAASVPALAGAAKDVGSIDPSQLQQTLATMQGYSMPTGA